MLIAHTYIHMYIRMYMHTVYGRAVCSSSVYCTCRRERRNSATEPASSHCSSCEPPKRQVCVCVYARACVHACMRACVCMSVHVCVRVCVYVCVCVRACVRACVCVCACVCVRVCLCVCMHVCVCVCVHACTNSCYDCGSLFLSIKSAKCSFHYIHVYEHVRMYDAHICTCVPDVFDFSI